MVFIYIKILNNNYSGFCIVVSLGFEPRLAEPESAVLPLHHETIFAVIHCKNIIFLLRNQ